MTTLLNKLNSAALILLFLYPFSVSWAAPSSQQKTDLLGTKVRIPANPKRIVLLAPSISDLVVGILDSSEHRSKLSQIVGVSTQSVFTSQAKITDVGPYHRPSLERILSLHPDLVVATVDGNPKTLVDQLRRNSISTLVLKSESLEDVLSSVELMAEVLSVPIRAVSRYQKLKSTINKYRQQNRDESSARLVVQISREPLVVAGSKNLLGEGLKLLGHTNLYANHDRRYPRPSLEDVATQNPDRILVLMGKKQHFPTEKKESVRFWKLSLIHI